MKSISNESKTGKTICTLTQIGEDSHFFQIMRVGCGGAAEPSSVDRLVDLNADLDVIKMMQETINEYLAGQLYEGEEGMSEKIMVVWESPTSEGTEAFRVGCKFQGWTVGEIKKVYSAGFPPRIFVYDTHKNVRVDMPYISCCVEYQGPAL